MREKKRFLLQKKIAKALSVTLLAFLMIVTGFFSQSVYAGTWTYSSSGTSAWTKDTDKSYATVSYNLFKTKKYVTYYNYYTGASFYKDYKAMTDSYAHYENNTDLKNTISVTNTHTFKGSGSGKVKDYAVSLGYEFSHKSGKSIEHSIAASQKSGYYYYGVRARTRDFMFESYQITYKKNDSGAYTNGAKGVTTVSRSVSLYPRNYYSWVYDGPLS